MNKKNSAFSLIELSIVILIIGILIAGVTQGSRLVKKSRVTTSKTITNSSPVSSIKNLVVWLDALSQEDFIESLDDGTDIETWYNINPQSTQSYNATQSTESKRPTYVEDGINGLPALEFNRSEGDCMAIADGVDGDSENVTGFLIFQPTATSGEMDLIEKWVWPGPDRKYPYVLRYLTRSSSYLFASYDGTESPVAFVETGVTLTKPILFSFRRLAGQNLKLWANRIQVGETVSDNVSLGTTSNDIDLYIGCRGNNWAYSDGYFGEVVIYNRALKTKERTDVEDYLMKKWKIK